MKIVLTVHQFLPEYSYGTEVLTFETAKQLKRLGHDVIVFSAIPDTTQLSDEERFDQYIYDGITVHRFHHSYMSMGGQTNVMELQYINCLFATHFKKFLMDEKPDLVHFFHFARLSASMIDVCVELGIPTVFTPTDFWIMCPTSQLRLPDNRICKGPDANGVNCLRHTLLINKSTRLKTIYKYLPDFIFSFVIFLALRKVTVDKTYLPMVKALSNRRDFLAEKINKIDKIIYPSRIMERILSENGLDQSKMIFIPFGLNFPESFDKKNVNTDIDVLRIGYIGSLVEHKGAHILLEAVSNINDRRLEVSIYGNTHADPKYFERLKRISNGNSKITFLGTFPNSKIAEILSSFDVLAIPSLWLENTPLILYSAQAAKCPVVASDVAGISEVIEHGKNGLLFEMGNSVELRNLILNLLEDKSLLKRFSENSKTPSSIEAYAEKLMNIYGILIQSEKSI